MSNIGGALDWRLLADRHRPRDPEQLRQEIRRHLASGLKPRDVAAAMRVDLPVVLSAASDGGSGRAA